MTAEVEDHVQVPPLLQPVARLAEAVLGDLSHLLLAEQEAVPLVGPSHHPQDVCIVRRVLSGLQAVYEAFNLRLGGVG